MDSPQKIPPLMWLGLAACCAIYVGHAWPNLDTTVDDAWISGRYALHLAEGHGPVYNAGEPPIEGYTNLLWVLWLALTHRLGLPMHPVMTYTGLLFGIGGLIAAFQLSRQIHPTNTPTLLLAPLLLALSPHYAVSSTNGLESSMYVFGVLASCAALWTVRSAASASSPEDPEPLWPVAGAGLLLGMLLLIRPEGAAVSALILAADLWTRRERLLQWATLLPGLLTTGILGGLLLWRRGVYGAWIPNTFHAKADLGWERLLELNSTYLGMEGWYWWIAGALLGLTALLPPWNARKAVALLLAFFTVGVGFRVHMWMPGARLMIPALALGICALVATVAAWRPLPRRIASVTLLIAGILPLLLPMHDRVLRYDRVHSVLSENDASKAAMHLAQHAPEGAWIAVRDAGVLSFYVGTGVRVAETHHRALTQPHSDGKDTQIHEVVPEDPTFVVLTQAREEAQGIRYANDRRVFRRLQVPYDYLGRVYQHYNRYYDLYARTDARIPPLPEAWVVNHAGPSPPRGP